MGAALGTEPAFDRVGLTIRTEWDASTVRGEPVEPRVPGRRSGGRPEWKAS